jgi:hypothetical protein
VINGYRGIALAADPVRGVLAEWRRPGPDGPVTETAWLSPAYIAAGGLSHGTAMTVASAQGSTAGLTLVYGLGLDPHQLYTAMSRDREAAHLYLPRTLLEDDTDRAIHGQSATPAEELQRAITAYARTLAEDHADRLVLAELGRVPEPLTRAQPEQTTHWQQRSYGQYFTGELEPLAARYLDAAARLAAWDQRTSPGYNQALAGNGPTAQRLHEQLDQLRRAAGAEALLPDARDTLDQARADFGTARQAYADASMQLTRSRLALALDGTSRRSLRADRDTASTSMQAAAESQRAAQDEIKQLTAAASAPYRPITPTSPWREGQATADLTRLTSTWDTRQSDTISRDIQTARRQAAEPGDHAIASQLHVTTPAEARKTAAEITAELHLRTTTSPERALSDDIQRAETRHQHHHPSPAPLITPTMHPDPYITPEPGITP